MFLCSPLHFSIEQVIRQSVQNHLSRHRTAGTPTLRVYLRMLFRVLLHYQGLLLRGRKSIRKQCKHTFSLFQFFSSTKLMPSWHRVYITNIDGNALTLAFLHCSLSILYYNNRHPHYIVIGAILFSAVRNFPCRGTLAPYNLHNVDALARQCYACRFCVCITSGAQHSLYVVQPDAAVLRQLVEP